MHCWRKWKVGKRCSNCYIVGRDEAEATGVVNVTPSTEAEVNVKCVMNVVLLAEAEDDVTGVVNIAC